MHRYPTRPDQVYENVCDDGGDGDGAHDRARDDGVHAHAHDDDGGGDDDGDGGGDDHHPCWNQCP